MKTISLSLFLLSVMSFEVWGQETRFDRFICTCRCNNSIVHLPKETGQSCGNLNGKFCTRDVDLTDPPGNADNNGHGLGFCFSQLLSEVQQEGN